MDKTSATDNQGLPQRVEALIKAGKMKEAASLADAAYVADPSDKDAIFAQGFALMRQGDFPAALTVYRKAIEADPAEADFYASIGDVYSSFGHDRYDTDKKAATLLYQDAFTAYEQALDRGLHIPLIILKVAMSAQHSGHHSRAVVMYEKHLELMGNDAVTLKSLGDTFMMDRQYDEAIPRYQAALSLNSKMPHARANLAKCNILRGDLKSAVACLFRKY